MNHWKYALAFAGVIGIGFAALAGQVPNPVNAPTGAISASSIPWWASTNAQQTSAIAPVNNAILATNGTGVPAETTSLPNGITIPAGDLPLPTASTLGALESQTCPSHQWLDVIPTTAVQPGCAQPAYADISGLGTAAQQNTGTSGGVIGLLNGNNTYSGTSNFTGTFEIGGTGENFPSSGALVGTSDTQTLTGKSIAASEINSGTLAVAQGGTNGATGKAAASNLSLPYVICMGAPNFSHTGDTSLTQMNATPCKIAANTLATGNIVRVWALWSATGTNNTKTVNSVWGTSNGTGGTACFSQSLAAATTSTGQSESWIGVTGSSVEKCYSGGSTGTQSSAPSSLALAVSSDIYVNFTAQLGNSSDNVTLVAYTVEVMQSTGN